MNNVSSILLSGGGGKEKHSVRCAPAFPTLLVRSWTVDRRSIARKESRIHKNRSQPPPRGTLNNTNYTVLRSILPVQDAPSATAKEKKLKQGDQSFLCSDIPQENAIEGGTPRPAAAAANNKGTGETVPGGRVQGVLAVRS